MQIVLYRGKSLIAKLIRWQTRSEYSHASILLEDGSVLESREFAGVRRTKTLRSDRKVKGVRVDIYDVELEQAQYDKLVEFATKQLGKKYDYSMVFRFITRQQESRSSCSKWFCSEFVFACLNKVGVKLLNSIDACKIAPGHLSLSTLLKFNHSEIL